MADKKISELDPFVPGSLQPTLDLLPIYDSSTASTKKVAVGDLISGLLSNYSIKQDGVLQVSTNVIDFRDNFSITDFGGEARIVITGKQDTLVSGTNIKTINGESILGSGDIVISTSVSWGEILGLLSDQTDLQNAFDLKANLSGAAFTGAVSVSISGSSDTLQLINSGSGTTLNILNSGSGDFFAIDTNKLVVSNNGNLAVDTNTLFVDAVNNRVGFNIAPLTNLHLKNNASSLDTIFRIQSNDRTVNFSLFNAPNVFEIDAAITRFKAQGAYPLYIANAGVSVGFTSTPSALLHVKTASTSTIGAIIQAAAGQTANLQEWKDSAGNVLASVSGGGNLAAELITFNNDDNQTNNTLPMLVGYYSNSSISINTPVEIFQYGVKGINNYNPYGYLYLNKYGDVSIIEGDRNSTTRLVFNRNGNKIYTESLFGINSSSPSAMLDIVINSTSRVGLEINAAAGQTANLQEWKDSAGNVLASIGSAGKLSIGSTGGLRYTPATTRYTDYNGLNLGGGIYMSFPSTGTDTFASYVGGGAIANVYMYWNSGGNINSRGTLLLGAADGAATVAGAASSAQLEVRSTTKGFLPPRMTGAQVEAIPSPAEGLIAYATNAGSGDVTAAGAYLYNGSNWELMSLQTELDTKADKLITANRQTESYTLVIGDADKLVEMNVGSANNLTVPLNSSVAFPTGTQISLAQYGAGQTTIVATSGVTIRSAGGALKLAAQYSGATLVKIDTDEWYLFGDITT